MPNTSPWIAQLNRTRPSDKLTNDLNVDVAVIGGGIAGVSTAYFTLRDTAKTVVLVEAYKVAHGATGHNAGQIVSYFERPLVDLVAEFGLELTGKGQAAIESTWVQLEEIMTETRMQTPVSQFTGYAGFSTLDQVLHRLEDNDLRRQMGLQPKPLIIAQEAGLVAQIPEEYKDLYTVLRQRDVLALLESKDPKYIAAMSSRKGCMNSAMFCEELIGFMLSRYKDRFILAEETPVSRLVLQKDRAILETGEHTVTAGRAVLCTNGFENIHIVNEVGVDIDGRYHEAVEGVVGYMAGYLDDLSKNPTAIAYFSEEHLTREDPYYYLTRRPFEDENHRQHNLICVGGPEGYLEDKTEYSREQLYPAEAQAQIDAFLKQSYSDAPQDAIDYQYQWHGLMGYTKNGVRMVGPEPCNETLLYNLGCNGVGILPSIYGGKKVSEVLGGIAQEESIFDVRDLRCYVRVDSLPAPAAKTEYLGV